MARDRADRIVCIDDPARALHVHRDERHADRGVVEGTAKALFGFEARILGELSSVMSCAVPSIRIGFPSSPAIDLARLSTIRTVPSGH